MRLRGIYSTRLRRREKPSPASPRPKSASGAGTAARERLMGLRARLAARFPKLEPDVAAWLEEEYRAALKLVSESIVRAGEGPAAQG